MGFSKTPKIGFQSNFPAPSGSGQGSSERVRYFAERVLNVRSDQQIKNAFRTRSFRCVMAYVKRLLVSV